MSLKLASVYTELKESLLRLARLGNTIRIPSAWMPIELLVWQTADLVVAIFAAFT